MPAPSLTYTLTNGTTADASQLMQNLNDLVNAMSDGTKDFSIAALTAAGTATFNGNVTFGNAAGDDISFNGSLASTIPIKTDATYDIGSSSLGLRSIYFGANSQRLRLMPSASMSASYTLTAPTTAGVAGQVLHNSGSGTLEWKPGQTGVHSVSSADYTVTDSDGYRTILVTTGSSNRTITLPTASDNTGRVITIKKADDSIGTVIIDGENSEAVDGAATYTISAVEGFSITVQCDGSNWNIINKVEVKYGSFSTTFTANGTSGGTTSSVTIRVTRVGDQVHLYIPSYNQASGTSSTAYVANTALPAWARPTASAVVMQGVARNSGAIAAAEARWEITNTGIISQTFGLDSLWF